MKESTLLLLLAGVGIGAGITYIIASGKTEELKKQIEKFPNIPQFIQIPQMSQYRETVSKEIQTIKETFISSGSGVISGFSNITNRVSSGVTGVGDSINKTISKTTETIKDATEKLKQSTQNIKDSVTNLASIPQKAIEKIQPVVAPAVVGGVVGGAVGSVVAPVFYRVGWELGKVTYPIGKWLIEKTGGVNSPIVKASQIITSIFGRWS